MNVVNLFHLSYWFYQPLIARGWVKWFWVLGFLSLVLSGLVVRIIRQRRQDEEIKEALRRLGNCGLAMGLLGLLWLFFRQEHVVFLAWRFWLALWLAGFLWWLCRVIKYIVRRLPEIKREKWERETREKYLPKRK